MGLYNRRSPGGKKQLTIILLVAFGPSSCDICITYNMHLISLRVINSRPQPTIKLTAVICIKTLRGNYIDTNHKKNGSMVHPVIMIHA